MLVYNYQKIYSNYLQNCNNWILDLNWDKTDSKSLNNWFSNVDETNLIYNSANLYQCNLINLTNIQYLSGIFYGCSFLNNINCSAWNLQEIKSFNNGFASCSNLISLNCSTWNLSNALYLQRLFKNCYNLTTLDMSNWNIAKTDRTTEMFANCYNLQNLNIMNWNVQNLIYISQMFYNCYSLNNLDFSSWQQKNGVSFKTLTETFYNCSNLQELNLKQWDFSTVNDCSGTFSGCRNLKTIIINDWDTRYVNSTARLFEDCISLENIDTSKWGNFANCNNMALMFCRCYNLINLNVSNWYFPLVRNMHGMFAEYTSIWDVGPTNEKFLDVSNWDVTYVYDMSRMFAEQENLHHLDISNWNTLFASNLSQMFINSYGTLDNGIFNGEKWNVRNVNYFDEMFRGAGIREAKIGAWNSPNAKSMSGMFRYCSFLTDQSLCNIAKLCLTCPNVTHKNLMINNMYSPVYDARKINKNTVPPIYCYQLLQNNWEGEFEMEESVSQDSAMISIEEISSPKDQTNGYGCGEVVKLKICVINNGNENQINGSIVCNINQEPILDEITLASGTISSIKMLKIPVTETMIRQGQNYSITFTYNYTVNNNNKTITLVKNISLAQLNPNLLIDFRASNVSENRIEGNIFVRNTGTATLKNISITSIIPSINKEDNFTITSLESHAFKSFDISYTKASGDADVIEWDINYSAQYENQQNSTQTISDALVYNIKTTPIQYKITVNTQSGYNAGRGYSEFYVTGFDNLINQIRNFGDFYIIEIEELEEEV